MCKISTVSKIFLRKRCEAKVIIKVQYEPYIPPGEKKKEKRSYFFFKLEVIWGKHIDLHCLYVNFAYNTKIP